MPMVLVFVSIWIKSVLRCSLYIFHLSGWRSHFLDILWRLSLSHSIFMTTLPTINILSNLSLWRLFYLYDGYSISMTSLFNYISMRSLFLSLLVSLYFILSLWNITLSGPTLNDVKKQAHGIVWSTREYIEWRTLVGGFGNFYTMKRAPVPGDLRDQLDVLEQKENEVAARLGRLDKLVQIFDKMASSWIKR